MPVHSSKPKTSTPILLAEAKTLGINPEPRSTLAARITAYKAEKEAAEKRPAKAKFLALNHATQWHKTAMDAVKTATVAQLKVLNGVLPDWRREIETHTGDDYTTIHAKWKAIFTGSLPVIDTPKPAPKAEPKRGKKAKGRKPKAIVHTGAEPVAVTVPVTEPVVEVPDLAAENALLKARIAELEAKFNDAKDQWSAWQAHAESMEQMIKKIKEVVNANS